MDKNYGFLFGAGAEKCYGMPLGPTFTRKTMLYKNKNLYDALGEFYNKRPCCNSGNKDTLNYSKEYLYAKNSADLKKIVANAAAKCEPKKGLRLKKDELDKILLYLGVDNNKKKCKKDKGVIKKFDKEFDKFYTKVVKNNKEEYGELLNNLRYYGNIEKYFSTIINPKDAGINKYWKLINYFWNAYFTILTPMLCNSAESTGFKCDKKSSDNNHYTKDHYTSVLDNLDEAINYIYSDKFLENYKKCEGDECDYYQQISAELKPYCILTTNYTPFVRKLNHAKTYYLAGKLSNFEIPNELKICELEIDGKTSELKIDGKTKKITDKHIFPYLLTQAPVKPIIEPTQIMEYSNAINALNELDTLIILGYSISENDNHVNSILRNFIVDEGKRIMYCDYKEGEGGSHTSGTNDWVADKLHLEEKDKDKIEIISFDGNAEKLVDKLTKKLGLTSGVVL